VNSVVRNLMLVRSPREIVTNLGTNELVIDVSELSDESICVSCCSWIDLSSSDTPSSRRTILPVTHCRHATGPHVRHISPLQLLLNPLFYSTPTPFIASVPFCPGCHGDG